MEQLGKQNEWGKNKQSMPGRYETCSDFPSYKDNGLIDVINDEMRLCKLNNKKNLSVEDCKLIASVLKSPANLDINPTYFLAQTWHRYPRNQAFLSKKPRFGRKNLAFRVGPGTYEQNLGTIQNSIDKKNLKRRLKSGNNKYSRWKISRNKNRLEKPIKIFAIGDLILKTSEGSLQFFGSKKNSKPFGNGSSLGTETRSNRTEDSLDIKNKKKG